MWVRRIKTIDRLYNEISKHDLVLVPTLSLADALHLHLEHYHFGNFALTPRRLATRRREPKEDRTAFLKVVETTNLDWKDASYAVGNVLQCWEYQETPDAILDYPRYNDELHQTTVRVLEDQDITSRHLTGYRIPGSKNVAVIGPELMTPLERSILPDNYTEVDPFTDETIELEPFHLFESKAAIIDALLETIDQENVEDVAIVLESGGSYSSLVESALEANDIPFHGGPGFIDQGYNRAFLQLLQVVRAGTDKRVRDVRALLNAVDVHIDVTHDEKYIHELEQPGIDWLHELQDSISDKRFEELVGEFESRIDGSFDDLREELQLLGILNEPVTEEAIDSLLYYFDRYKVPVERDNEGVLLADAQSTTYVDRPLVFYLGLDSGWNHEAPKRPWIDEEDQYRKHLKRFQIALQNGVDQYYLVQDSTGGHPVQPCIYFEELADTDFERFSDLDHVPHTRTTRSSGDGFARKSLDIDIDTVDTWSQSSLNTYVNSPRDYFFDQLLDQPDRDFFREGKLFHDFAELYAVHPDIVDEEVVEQVVDYMLDIIDPFIHEGEREMRRAKYRIGLRNIMQFLDSHPPNPPKFLSGGEGFWGNDIADQLDVTCDEPYTEHWFRNRDLGIKGSIDLVRTSEELVDYKTGGMKKPSELVRNSSCDPPGDTPDYQAVMYLAQHRTQVDDPESLSFTFLHFLENTDDVVAGTPSIDDCKSTLNYQHCSFHGYIQRESVHQYLREEHHNDCNDTFTELSYDEYRRIVASEEPPDTLDKEEFLESEFASHFKSEILRTIGECDADVEKGCTQALKHFYDINRTTLFRENLDEFEEFVEERLEELNDRLAGNERFPVSDLKDEPYERWLNNRDLLLKDD